MKSLKTLIAAVACAAVLSGCTFFQSLSKGPGAVVLEQAAVAAGVAAVVKGDPIRAAVVVKVAQAVLAIDTGSTVSLADVEAVLNAQIALLHLPPADAALAAALTAAVEQAIQDQLQVTAGKIPPSTQVAIATVAKWVIVDAGGSVS